MRPSRRCCARAVCAHVVSCIGAGQRITTPRRHAKGSIDVTLSVRRGEHSSIANGRRRRGSNLCAGRPPLRERNRDRLRPALVRYAAWNAAISAAADWRETVAAGASGAS